MDNCHKGTCGEAAFRNALSAINRGFPDAKIIEVRPRGGGVHMVAEVTDSIGMKWYLSAGEITDDVLRIGTPAPGYLTVGDVLKAHLEAPFGNEVPWLQRFFPDILT